MGFRIVDANQLLERLDIRHESKGDTLWASCPHPDHNDSSPSWRIINDPENTKHGQHRCYGCGFGGWPIHLVEAVLSCTRQEAREWLRDISKEPPLPFAVNVDYQRGMPTRFELPPGVIMGKPLPMWNEEARDYALTTRHLKDWQIDRWGIGYTIGRYNKDSNPLAGRLVFPVRDSGRKLIGYTGRSYTGSERRYKEPSKKEGADLGAVFGEEHWPTHGQRRVVVVTEGALDALAVERAYPYSLPIAGIYGSQLHDGHVNRLSTFPYVLMATDADKAGNKVVSELEQQLRRWSQVIRVELPEGEDADSLAAKDVTLLKDAVGSALRVVYADRDRVDVEARPKRRRRRSEGRPARKRR